MTLGEDISGLEASDDAEKGFLGFVSWAAIKNLSLPAFSHRTVAYQHHLEQEIEVFAHAACDWVL